MAKPYELSSELRFYSKQYSALLDLSRSDAIDSGETERAFNEIVKTASTTLECERVSIWLFNASRDAITCVALYQRSRDEFSFGEILHSSHFPEYFAYLNEERFLSVTDVYEDSVTRCFANGYLEQHDIRSMLDAPIRIGGIMQGVLCHEQCGSIREWSIIEQGFAGILSEMISRAIVAKERKEAYKKLQELNLALEDKVLEKTGHLEASLRSSEEKLQRMQELNRERNSLLGMVVHDLRNPITSALLYLENILLTSSSPDIRHYSTLAMDTLHRMNKAISLALEAVREEASGITLRKRTIDLTQLIELVMAMNEEQAKRKQQLLLLETTESCFAFVDEDKLCEVLDNLISNAIKYSDRGKSIRIRVHRKSAPVEQSANNASSLIVITIIDDGQGFDEEDKKQLFQEFHPLSSHPTGGESATGLGLSIVKHLIELHQGSVFIHSEGKNMGSTVTIELPALAIT